MTEFDQSHFRPDEIFFSGRLQVETAISVLEFTGVNPEAEVKLKALRDAHELSSTPGAMDNLTIYLNGGIINAMKADIVTSALLVEANQTLPDQTRVAASALLEILGIEK